MSKDIDLNKVVLVDMDGVLCDFIAGFENVWKERFPDRPTLAEIEDGYKSYQLYDAYPKEYHDDINAVMQSEAFYRNLPPIPGAIDAIHAMRENGWKPYICTAPLASSPFCMSDKQAWVEKHLGKKWVRRMILTFNKALVRGKFLIDDNPSYISCSPNPTWELLLFDRPYNQDMKGAQRINWESWESVLWETRLNRPRKISFE